MTATDRFKWLLANALERVCVLEEQVEQLEARIKEFETEMRVPDDIGIPER